MGVGVIGACNLPGNLGHDVPKEPVTLTVDTRGKDQLGRAVLMFAVGTKPKCPEAQSTTHCVTTSVGELPKKLPGLGVVSTDPSIPKVANQERVT
jgi:hypothetical protein